MDKTSMTLGYLVGRMIIGQRKAVEKVPVAYLYGTLRIPFKVEWDAEEYPYAALFYTDEYTDGTVMWYLVCSKEQMYLTYRSNAGYSLEIDSDRTRVYGLKCMFRYPIDLPTADKFTETYVNGSIAKKEKYIWANYDLCYLNGTVVLAASEPVPVYE